MATGSAFFESTNGRHIFEQWWHPEGTARAVVAICHGFAEHSGRYSGVADYLNERGYAVEALDLRGHGLSDGPRVHIRSFNEYLDDLSGFLLNSARRNPGAPAFLLGHSMGGGVAALYVLVRQPGIAGLILSGPALQLGAANQPLHRRAVFGALRLVPWLHLPGLPPGSVSRDPHVLKRYDEDPLVYHGGPTVGLARAGARASDRISRDMERVQVPLLIVHGAADRLVETAGSEELHARAQSPDKALKLYPGLYHEVLNEPERLDVLGDVADWLDQRVPGSNR